MGSNKCGVGHVVSHGLSSQYKTRTADRTGCKTQTEYKMWTEFKNWCTVHKSQKMLLFQFSPALLSWASFNYSISFRYLKYGFENSENYFQIRQQQGTLNFIGGRLGLNTVFVQTG